MTESAQQKRDEARKQNRKAFPVTASIVDDFRKHFGQVKVLSTTETAKK